MRYLCLFLPFAMFGQDAMRAAIEKQRSSIASQRESVRKQAATAAVWLVPFSAPAIEAGCDPESDSVIGPIVDEAAKAQQLEPRLIRAVIERESGFRACAVSAKGAIGMMQLMPATVEQLEVKDPFDPKQNIIAGARYLKQVLDRYKGDLPQALGAYNAGPAAVDQAGGVPDIPETREYVDAILKKLGISTEPKLSKPAPPNNPKPKPTGN